MMRTHHDVDARASEHRWWNGNRRAVARLTAFCGREEHHFWTESVSLRDLLRPGAVITHRQITDVYLLGLAAHHGGKLATFDRSIPTTAVYGGREVLAVIPV